MTQRRREKRKFKKRRRQEKNNRRETNLWSKGGSKGRPDYNVWL